MDKAYPDRPGSSDPRHPNDPGRRGALDSPPAHEPGPRDLNEGYEHRDVGLRPVVLSLLGLVISTAVVILIGKWFNDAVVDYVQAEQKEEFNDDRPHHLPEDPRLQPSIGHGSLDRQDMEALRNEQIGEVKEDRLEGGLGRVGWAWDARAGQPQVGEDLRDRVSQWLRSPVTTQPTTAPVPVGTGPETNPSAGGAPAGTQPTTAPSATTEPAGPTTQPAGAAPATKPSEKPADEPAAKPIEDRGKATEPAPNAPTPPAAPTPRESGEK